MKIIDKNGLKILKADEGKKIKGINDNYIAEHTDENGNLIPESIPYLADIIYLGGQIQTLEQTKELYEEIEETL